MSTTQVETSALSAAGITAQRSQSARLCDSLGSSINNSITNSTTSSTGGRARRLSNARYHTLSDNTHYQALEPSCLETLCRLGEGGYAVVEKAW
jgi:hypothetical protein